jgi:orotate phosphoribosyltransferase
MKLTSERARDLLAQSGAILQGHFVGTSGKHLSVYITKDRATRFTSVASELCQGIAEHFADEGIEAVVAPAVGAIALSQWTAYHLTRLRPDLPEVLALYAEHPEEVLRTTGKGEESIVFSLFDKSFNLDEGTEVILRSSSFILKRGFNEDIRGKRVLGVEDILTTGGSAKQTACAIVEGGGILVGFGVLANGGKVTAEDIGVERLEALISVDRKIFTERDCASHGLCAQGIPIDTEFGHGKDFLARKSVGK